MEMPVEKKEKRTGAIIGTVAAIVLCGLTGLCLLCPGGVAILVGFFDGVNLPYIQNWWGIALLCLSVVFIVIAVLVPVLTLRKKPAPMPEPTPGESLPPVS